MAEGRGRQSWAHTSAILALIANVNRDPKKTRPFKPSDFDPYSAKDKRDAAIEVKDMDVLKSAFLRGTVPAQIGNTEVQS
ncbi:MAG: hypothetical protein GXY83_35970 [Rhodopirellula sp.]|nr:hypothetical protein [Rhodopirellula sp.]